MWGLALREELRKEEISAQTFTESQEGVENGVGGDFQSRIDWDFTQPQPALQCLPQEFVLLH